MVACAFLAALSFASVAWSYRLSSAVNGKVKSLALFASGEGPKLVPGEFDNFDGSRPVLEK